MSLTPEQWARITALYDELHAQTDEARASALRALDEAEPALAGELRSLLAADTDAAFLAGRGPLPFEVAVGTARLIGRTVGTYRIEREIGRGGMGVVYEAQHTDPSLAKRVAIKTLAIGLDRPELAWRFRRERQILAQLDHPNIAALYDGGATADGMPYLVMEYVDGTRIDQWCDAQRLTIPQRLDLFRQVCAAVQFAHSKLVVHRDLKPSNILVTRDGVVKLLDFGIAKLTDVAVDSADEPTEVTRFGGAPLTTAYASPEQLRGEDATIASDVFALGVVLYRLLCGGLPFESTESAPGGARTTEAPPPPSAVITDDHSATAYAGGRGSIRQTLRGELDAIVLMALRAEPERRYASAEALSTDLQRYLKGLPVQARPDTVGYRVRKFVARRRALVAGIGIGAAALVLGAVMSQRAATDARAQATRSARVTRLLQEMIGSGDQSFSRFTSPPTLTAVLDSARVRVAAELADDPQGRADLYRTFASTYVTFNRIPLARMMLDSALLLHRRADRADDANLGRDLIAMASIRRFSGQTDSGVADLQEAIARLQSTTVASDSDLVRARTDLGDMLALLYFEPVNAEPNLRDALVRERKRDRPRRGLLARIIASLAVVELAKGQLVASDTLARQATALLAADSALSFDHLLATAYLGERLQNLGQHGPALALLEPAIAQTERRFGREHLFIAEVQGTHAVSLMGTGRDSLAAVLLDSAIALTGRQPTHDPAYLANLFIQRATIQVKARDSIGATALIARARAETLRMGRQRPVFEATLRWLAAAVAMIGSHVELARARLVDVVQFTRETLGPTHIFTTLAQAHVAEFSQRYPPPASAGPATPPSPEASPRR